MIGGELDSGDIIMKTFLSININTRVGQVYEWMEKEIPNLIYKSIEKLTNESFIPEKQSVNPDDAIRTYPRNPDDGEIDWTLNADYIVRLINASSEPFSGAFSYYNGEKIIIWRAKLFSDHENYYAVPGQISKIDKLTGNIIIISGNGKVEVEEIEHDNKRGKPIEFVNSIRSRFK